MVLSFFTIIYHFGQNKSIIKDKLSSSIKKNILKSRETGFLSPASSDHK